MSSKTEIHTREIIYYVYNVYDYLGLSSNFGSNIKRIWANSTTCQ